MHTYNYHTVISTTYCTELTRTCGLNPHILRMFNCCTAWGISSQGHGIVWRGSTQEVQVDLTIYNTCFNYLKSKHPSDYVLWEVFIAEQ